MKHLKKDNRKTKKRTFRITMRGGDNELLSAAKIGDINKVNDLISQGADVNKGNYRGETPLYWASYEGHLEVVRALIAAGADVNKSDDDDWTPLYWASYGHLEVVRALLAAGADVNKSDDFGMTPLNMAEVNGHDKIVDLLLRAMIKQGYRTREDLSEDSFLREKFDKIQKEKKIVSEVTAKTKLPSEMSKEIGKFLGGKRKTKKSKTKKHSNKRVTKKQRTAI